MIVCVGWPNSMLQLLVDSFNWLDISPYNQPQPRIFHTNYLSLPVAGYATILYSCYRPHSRIIRVIRDRYHVFIWPFWNAISIRFWKNFHHAVIHWERPKAEAHILGHDVLPLDMAIRHKSLTYLRWYPVGYDVSPNFFIYWKKSIHEAQFELMKPHFLHSQSACKWEPPHLLTLF